MFISQAMRMLVANKEPVFFFYHNPRWSIKRFLGRTTWLDEIRAEAARWKLMDDIFWPAGQCCTGYQGLRIQLSRIPSGARGHLQRGSRLPEYLPRTRVSQLHIGPPPLLLSCSSEPPLALRFPAQFGAELRVWEW